MRTITIAVCCVMLALATLSAQETKKDTSVSQGEMKMKESSQAMECSHCTKDKKCEMHAKGAAKKEMTECPHCTGDTMCEMHAKKGMKKQGMKKGEMKKSGTPK